MTEMTRAAAENFLFREAELLDGWRLEEWLDLFTEDGIYWIPIDETKEPNEDTSLVYDVSLRRQERVFRLQETNVTSQSPRSRTLHTITNVRITADATTATVKSNQLITELRSGDFRQTGLGEQRVFAGEVEHRLVLGDDGGYRIALKKIVLLNRDIVIRNLTFIA